MAQVPLAWTIVLFSAALFLRLYLAPRPFFEADIRDNISRGQFLAQHGVTTVNDWNQQHGVAISYPPLFCYQEALVSKIAQRRLVALQQCYPEVAAVWTRVRFKLLPITYDLLIGVGVLWFLARRIPSPWPLVGAAAYLLNPCVFMDSGAWGQTDSVYAFAMFLTIGCVIAAWSTDNDAWLGGAWAMAALAICQKLQAVMILPLLAIYTLMRRKVSLPLACAAVFILFVAAIYSPFAVAKRWDYFHSVFISSFTAFAVTQANAFNFWALGPVVSSHTRICGLCYAQIGQALYLVSLIWLGWCAFRARPPQNDPIETARRIVVAAVHACVAPFMVLTNMHERYVAPAIIFLVVAAFLDRRMMWLAVGFSATFLLNIVYVGNPTVLPLDELAVLNASRFALRVFGSTLNIGMFVWLTARLPALLSTAPAQTALRSAEQRHAG